MDYILEPKMDSSMTYMHIKVKLCSTWDHFPVNAKISEDDGQVYFTQQKEKWDGQDGCCMTKEAKMIQKTFR